MYVSLQEFAIHQNLHKILQTSLKAFLGVFLWILWDLSQQLLCKTLITDVFEKNVFFHKTEAVSVLLKRNSSHVKCVFKTQSKIYDGAFLRKQLTAFSRWLYSQKSSILDIVLGSTYASVDVSCFTFNQNSSVLEPSIPLTFVYWNVRDVSRTRAVSMMEIFSKTMDTKKSLTTFAKKF